MKPDFEKHRDIWGPMMALQLRWWSAGVFGPARLLQDAGLYQTLSLGPRPSAAPFQGGAPSFAGAFDEPQMLSEQPPDYSRLRLFDIAADEYQSGVEPFSAPVFEQVLAYLEPRLVPCARVLDVGCGPGREACLLAQKLPEGEVVACDLSAPMIQRAWRAAKEKGLDRRMAFFQRDAAALPDAFTGHFDAVVCNLSFQYFLDGPAVARQFHRVLAPGGLAFVADPGPAWFIATASGFAALSNPAFVQYRTGEEFRALFLSEGFASAYWAEVLPGMGLTIASK